MRIYLFVFSIFLSTISFAAPQNDALKEFPKRVKKITLKNGLRVLMVERPNIPTISFAVYIRTGGIDDAFGQSGISHMFEHMLFKGTKTIGTKNYAREKKWLRKIDAAALALQKEQDKGDSTSKEIEAMLAEKLKTLQEKHEAIIIEEEFWKIYEQAGGRGLNAGTGFDYTNYKISLPANQLKLWMMMESERIKNPVLREFYKERDVVLEERRLRVDNKPSGKLWESFLATAFIAHNYGRPIIGWENEVSRLTTKDTQTFFKDHYDISRLVFVMVGGFDSKEAEKMVQQYFGDIPSKISSKEHFMPLEPKQEGERRVEVEFPAEPSLLIGYHRPNFMHPDSAALEVLSDLLSTGRTSRFNKSIIEKKRIGISAWAGSSTPGEREPCLFVVGGSPRAPHTTADLEEAFYAEIEKIKNEGPSDIELKKVKNFSVDYLIRALSSNDGLARHLGYYESIAGNWEFLFQIIEDIQKVTKEDVLRVANAYLIKSNRTVGTLVKVDPK